MKTIIQSLTIGKEEISLFKQDESQYVLERRFNGEVTVSCEFPLSMFRDANDYYRELANTLIIENEDSLPGTDGGLH